MMWFFGALIVVAMGGVAALAAGRGTPMADAYDDRPDATVPAGGPLGADDLRRVRFSLAFRGYRMSEVDALLERLAAERDLVRSQELAFRQLVDPAPRALEGPGPVSETPAEAPSSAPFTPPGPAVSTSPFAPAEPDGGPGTTPGPQ